jgi:Fe-S cluster biosynthesis and repair protein YggX
VTRIIHCVKLQIDAAGLGAPPYPGELGKKVYEQVSAEAWQLWQGQQTMLINEHRLSMMDPKARDFLRQEMVKFLFEGGSEKPAGYVPPVENS